MSQLTAVMAESVQGRSPSQMAWERIKKDKTAKVSGGIILFFVLIAVLAPVFTWIMHTTPDAFHTDALNQEFGTQPLGRLGEFQEPTGLVSNQELDEIFSYALFLALEPHSLLLYLQPRSQLFWASLLD